MTRVLAKNISLGGMLLGGIICIVSAYLWNKPIMIAGLVTIGLFFMFALITSSILKGLTDKHRGSLNSGNGAYRP